MELTPMKARDIFLDDVRVSFVAPPSLLLDLDDETALCTDYAVKVTRDSYPSLLLAEMAKAQRIVESYRAAFTSEMSRYRVADGTECCVAVHVPGSEGYPSDQRPGWWRRFRRWCAGA